MEDGAVGLRSAASTEHLSHFLVSLATVYGVGMLESGLSVLRTFLFAGWMGRERYGAFTLATSLVTFLLPLAGLQISSAFSRYVPEYERRGSLRIFLRRSFAIVAVSSAVFFLVSQAAAERLARLVFQQEGYAPLFRLASLGLVFTSFYSVGLAALRGLRMFRSTSALELLKTAVFTALGAALLLAAGRRAEWAITANLIAVGGVAAVFAATLTRRGRSWPRTADIEPLGPFARRLLAFSSAYIGNTLLGGAFAFLSKWLVNVFVSLEETGVFSFAMQISQMLFLLITTFNLVLSPYLATMWVQGERRQAAQILHLTSKVTLLGLIAGALAMQIGANLVIPRWMPEYAGALPLIRILLAAQLCNASVWTYGQYANLLERPNLKMMATGLGLALFVATSLHLGPKMGALGVAWSYLAAYAAVLAVTLWYTLRVGLALERSVALAAAAPCFLAIPTYVGMALVAAGLLAAAAWTPWILNAEEKAVVVQLLRRQNRKDGVEEAKGQKDQRAP